ncbi:GGDEF domain-containing protein [Shewanella donghaensis]|uniref:GGDEF domain-containing protein n=1 Tax=Shewanella donghaensis TaxID=238836 RepID=UPI001182DEDF|nr:GGDEF domain-containing protein [Shewanella donghaensis]
MNKIGLTGEFINPVIETAFRKDEWDKLRNRMVFTSFVGGLIYFLAVVGDYMIITSPPMFHLIVLMRLSVLLMSFVVCICGIKLKQYTPILNLVLCNLLLLLLLGESAELVIKGDLIEYGGIPGVSLLVLLFYLSFPPRFISILAVCLTGSGAFVITTALLGYASVEYIYTSVLFLMVVNCFGAYVYLQFSTIRRREFSALEELKINAEIDGLTQVYNRRKVLELGDNDVDNAINHGHEYSVIMVDVDNFKSINDTYGHAIGDQVLSEIASRCRNVLREFDIFGRFGGEEFVVFLPQTNINTALIVGERLRNEISATPFNTNQFSFFVTISLGAAALTEVKEAPRKLLEMADEALYTAKRTGKNKVCACRYQ